MASKRKFINASFSLYDDLDIGSTSEAASVAKTEVTAEKTPVAEKRRRNSEVREESTANNVKSGIAADRSLISVCGWRKGEREDMQDAHFFDDHFGLPASDIKRSALYAIFDGHAGRKAADFAKEHLPAKLKEKFSVCTSVESIEKVLKRTYIDCFKQVDEEFLHEARRVKPSWKDGTTVTTILIVNNVLYCANIGDSRAVVCRSKGGDSVVALQLTVDHSPLQFDERMRIQKAGGNVKDGRIMGVLEVSRSIGDGQFKAHGVTCIPDVKKFSITSDDRFVLIACDGLWKTFNNKEAVEFVTKELKAAEKKPELVEDQPGSLRHLECERVADALAAEAVKRGCGDNVSVLIILFDNPPDSADRKA